MTSVTEAEIKAAGADVAPRVTPEDIAAAIVSEYYFTGAEAAGLPPVKGMDYIPSRAASPLDLLTLCVLVLKNGFTVTGESACASPENFNAEIGRKIARAMAVSKIWMLEGYLLKDLIYQASLPAPGSDR